MTVLSQLNYDDSTGSEENVWVKPLEKDSKTRLKRAGGISATAALLNFVKGMLGPGFLCLPLAFKQAGLWAAFVIVFVFGFLNNYCMLQLVNSSQYLCTLTGRSELRYGDVAYEACANSFLWLRPHKKTMRIFTNAMLVLLQMGVCSVSYVFISTHLKQIIEALIPDTDVPITTYMLAIFLPLVAINCTKSMKAIVYLSVLGNILMLTSFVAILEHLITSPHVLPELPWVTTFNGVASAAGSILYSFEGQAMVLPLENQLKHAEDMVGVTGVLSTGMSFVTIVYATSGFFGYITFGNNVKGSITLNLPDKPLFLVVKGMFTMIVYVGFVLQQYIVVETLWPTLGKMLEKRSVSSCTTHIAQYAFRALLVMIAMLVAMGIPNLELIVPFVGIVSGMILAFVLPAFIDTITFLPVMIKRRDSKCRIAFRLIQNTFLTLLGLFGLFDGLQSSIQDIINKQ